MILMIVGSSNYFNRFIESCKTSFSTDAFNQSTSRVGRAVHRFAIRILKALHFKNYSKLAEKRLVRLETFERQFQDTIEQFKIPHELGSGKEAWFKEWKTQMVLRSLTLSQHHPEKKLTNANDILFTHWALRGALHVAKRLKRDAKTRRLEHSFLNFVAEKQNILTPKFAKFSLKKKLAVLNAIPEKMNPSSIEAKETFVLKRAHDDGNCLFHSLQMGLGLELSVPEFRISVYEYMREHLSDYQEQIKNVLMGDVWDRVKNEGDIVISTASLPSNLQEQFTLFWENRSSDEEVSQWIEEEGAEAYIKGMSEVDCRSYAGTVELQAISDQYNRPIHLTVHAENHIQTMIFGENRPVEPIYLNLANKHYDLLVKQSSQ